VKKDREAPVKGRFLGSIPGDLASPESSIHREYPVRGPLVQGSNRILPLVDGSSNINRLSFGHPLLCEYQNDSFSSGEIKDAAHMRDIEWALKDARAFVDRARDACLSYGEGVERWRVIYAQLDEVVGELDTAGWRQTAESTAAIDKRRKELQPGDVPDQLLHLQERIATALRCHAAWKALLRNSDEGESPELEAASETRAAAVDEVAVSTYAIRAVAGSAMTA
jgi:hypothetical protein